MRLLLTRANALGETLCYIYHELHGVATNTVRPFNIFGPGMQEADYPARRRTLAEPHQVAGIPCRSLAAATRRVRSVTSPMPSLASSSPC